MSYHALMSSSCIQIIVEEGKDIIGWQSHESVTDEHHSYVSPVSGFNQNSQNLGETAADDRLRWAEEGLEPFDQNTE